MMTVRRSMSLKKRDLANVGESDHVIQKFQSFKKKKQLEVTLCFKSNPNLFIKERKNYDLVNKVDTKATSPEHTPSPELDDAATKLQKAYKSYRTRRNLADCAVVVEELWWKALDFASLRQSSISFFESDRSETAVSRWARATTRAAKLGKGLIKDEKAQKLALRYWLEAIDPRHRYGHNLHLYYNVWFASESSQPFFYWLDVGDGKEENLDTCPRTELQRQCIKYLGPKEREAYEVIVVDGKLVYKQSGKAVVTEEGSKWIFVLSASRALYVGKKEKGQFQHSSFLAGGAAIAAGRLVAHHGVLEGVWSYSGHYRPTEDSFLEFISFLEDQNIDLTNVKKCPMDDDIPPTNTRDKEHKIESKRCTGQKIASFIDIKEAISIENGNKEEDMQKNVPTAEENIVSSMVKKAREDNTEAAAVIEEKKALSCKWSTGVGARIGCVREYPPKLQLQALEHVKLSPRNYMNMPPPNFAIPSPRPTTNIHLSPTLARMGHLPTRTPHISTTN